MEYHELKNLINNQKYISEENISDLNSLLHTYPYFLHPRLLSIKSLFQSDRKKIEELVHELVLYLPDNKFLYELIYGAETQKRPLKKDMNNSGEYFEMMKILDKNEQNNKESLSLLAEKLKKARDSLAKSKS